MLRTFYSLAAALTIGVVGAGGQSARAEGIHDARLKCAKVCADCQLACNACSTHCLKLTAAGKNEHAKMVQLCADCGECCRTCSSLCAREGPLVRHVLECCAKCCDDCAAGCDPFSADKQMAACAKSCQDCAKECRDLLKSLDN